LSAKIWWIVSRPEGGGDEKKMRFIYRKAQAPPSTRESDKEAWRDCESN